jgi:hypothetical protein
MQALLFNTLIPMIVTYVVTHFGKKWSHTGTVLDIAKTLLQSRGNNITEPEKAIEQAIIQAQFDAMGPMVQKLDEQIKSGDLEVRSAEARGREMAKGMDITRVDPTTGEESKVDTSS